MKKSAFLYTLQTFLSEEGLYLDSVAVSSGGACLLHGVRQETADLDLDIPQDAFNRIQERLTPGRISLNYHSDLDHYHPAQFVPYIQYSPTIQLFVEDVEREVVMIDDVPVYSLDALITQKVWLNRPKDQADLQALYQLKEESYV